MSEKIVLAIDLMLVVPFSDKEKVKKMGAKPFYENGVFKCWFVPRGIDVSPFKPWWKIESADNETDQEVKTETVSGCSLKEILSRVKGTIEKQFAQPVWIRAEIVNLSGGNPHVYLELSDYDTGGVERAKARAMIWGSQIEILKKFESETGFAIKSGVKILFKAQVEFSERFGLALKIVDIDSRFTLGDMEAKLLAIRNRLKSEGLYDLNRNKMPPKDYYRVAIIAPDDAAGLGDFMTQANKLTQYELCHFVTYSAKFQGQNVINSVSLALDQVLGAIKNGIRFDAVVLIRGGGDKSGLYALNEYQIAQKICLMPIPVMIGIGHERDNTILDEICCIRCSTPSLVIAKISETIVNNAKHARENMIHLHRLVSDAMHRAQRNCERLDGQITMAASRILQQSRKKVELEYQQVNDEAKHAISRAKNQLHRLITEALYSDPKQVVRKGYAFVRNQNGKVVGDSSKLSSGEEITIEMRDGSFEAIKV